VPGQHSHGHGGRRGAQADKTRVKDYIHRLDNFDGPAVGEIAVGYEMFEEAFEIYRKFGLKTQAIRVLLDHQEDLDRALEYALKARPSPAQTLRWSTRSGCARPAPPRSAPHRPAPAWRTAALPTDEGARARWSARSSAAAAAPRGLQHWAGQGSVCGAHKDWVGGSCAAGDRPRKRVCIGSSRQHTLHVCKRARPAAGRWTSRRCGQSWATRSWTAARSATPLPATCAGARPGPTFPPADPVPGPSRESCCYDKGAENELQLCVSQIWLLTGVALEQGYALQINSAVPLVRLPRPPARGKAGPEAPGGRRAQRRRGAVRGRDRALQRGVRLRRPGQVPAHGPQEGQGPAGARPAGRAPRRGAAPRRGGRRRRPLASRDQRCTPCAAAAAL